VLLRLIDSKGAPNVKLAATEDGSAMSLVLRHTTILG